jgi:hypothetical protein
MGEVLYQAIVTVLLVTPGDVPREQFAIQEVSEPIPADLHSSPEFGVGQAWGVS